MGDEVFQPMMRGLVRGVAFLALLGRPAAAESPDTFARVVVAQTEARAGPGVGHRVLHQAVRGEVFTVRGREAQGFWLRIELPDGSVAYVLGDTVETLTADSGADGGPRAPGLFAPPALQEARGGLALSGGVFDGSGFALAELAAVLSPALAIEGFGGLALSRVGRQLVYGAGPTLNIGPDWPLAPFVHVGAGGITTTFAEGDPRTGSTRWLARAGGGLLISLRWRILVRLEAMHNVVFEPDFKASVQSYAGGLGTYF
jgi:hypothetical protein